MPTLLTEALNLKEGDQPDREIIEAARRLIRLESAVRAALCRTVAVMISQGAHQSSGHATAADLLRSEFHLSGREANEFAVSAVRLREQLHCTFVALQSGAITWSHATTLVRAVDRLGIDTVRDTEHDWIELIATRTGPEVLQRVVHTRHLEQVGYPSPPAPEADKDRDAPPITSGAYADTSTNASEAANASNDSQAPGTGDGEEPSQEHHPDASSYEEPQERGYLPRSTEPDHDVDTEPRTALTPMRPVAPTLTPSGDNDSCAAEKLAMSIGGCLHPACASKASAREIAFEVCWLDGSRTSILTHGPVCDEHAAALASCPVNRIRVGHGSATGTIGPALVTDAA
ncbi:hypothetical protein [Kutzneria sp. CA-103260]|uniref:hypothetical protein n=1 Tax=Kutzneria sp. CA-103260 TaxID=2802641 RepID=UPI001BA8B58A|nr:hypothetical protein [Kutzneria sp. CA-103260]